MPQGDIELTADGRTLATRVHSKYPGAYDDLTDQDLEAKVKSKYPGVYDDLPTTTATPAKAAGSTASIGPPSEDAPVTLGDLLDNPMPAIKRMGHLVKRDLSDPKTWVELAAIYAGPKVLEAVPGAASALRGPISRGATTVGNVLDTEGFGPVRPIGKTLRGIGKLTTPPPAPPPFHELPLAKQMEQLPADRPGPAVVRSGGPPVRGAASEPVPFHELPLAKQLEQLPMERPAPERGRTGIAIRSDISEVDLDKLIRGLRKEMNDPALAHNELARQAIAKVIIQYGGTP